jgi:XRE family transcriptional regulator, regulator of sulfur utilization
MMTRRELCAGMLASAAAGEALALADPTPVMGSTIFDWNAIPENKTETGSVRSFCKSRTATLDELEIHVTTLDPGKA